MKLIQVSDSPTVKWQRLWEFSDRGSNGERWARNNNTAYLADHHPGALSWAET